MRPGERTLPVGFQVDSADGSMRGQQAVVYLQAAAAKPSQAGAGAGVASGAQAEGKTASGVAAGAGFMGGKVERVVASGNIEMQQPGRHATG